MRSLKIFGVCLLASALAEAMIYHFAHRSYVEAVTIALLIGWAIGSLLVAWFEPRLLCMYWGSVALAAPAISYSMLGHGIPEMGGLLHPLMAGIYAVPFWYLFRRIRNRRFEGGAELGAPANGGLTAPLDSSGALIMI